MTPARFMRQRDLIEARQRSAAWTKRALQHLVREAGAAAILVRGQLVAHQLPGGCIVCVKRRFPTQAAADAVLANILGVTNGTHTKPQRAYLCPHCHGWHLTSAEPLK